MELNPENSVKGKGIFRKRIKCQTVDTMDRLGGRRGQV
jgi:hypothetical protein